MSKPRKPIAELIEELRSWLQNYDHGPDSFPNTFYRIIASLPGGDELEDMGYEALPSWRSRASTTSRTSSRGS